MATLTMRKGRPIIQVLNGLKRSTISLGGFSERQAKAIKAHVEAIQSAKLSNTSIPAHTSEWLRDIDGGLHEKIVAAGLLEPRKAKDATMLKPYFDAYIKRRIDLKPRSISILNQASDCAVEFFGFRDMATITRGEVKDWHRNALEHYSEATVAGFTKKLREVYADAIDRKLLTENPFKAVKIGSFVNEERLEYVPRETIARVINSTDDLEWKLLFGLSRYAGLRIPSEIHALDWENIDWDNNRFTVRESKTKTRVVPIFPELLSHFHALCHNRAFVRSGAVFTRLRGPNLGTQAVRIIKRAGIKPWAKTFHNLRASCETDLVQRFPVHVACKWIGNSEIIARKHYLQVTDQHFQDAVRAAPRAAVSAGQHRTQGEPAMQNPTGNDQNGDKFATPWGYSTDAVSTEKQQINHEALQQALHPLRNPKFKGPPDLPSALAKIRKAAERGPR